MNDAEITSSGTSSGPEQVSAACAAPHKPWGPTATLGWGLLAAAVFIGVQTAVVIAFVVIEAARHGQQDMAALAASLEYNGLLVSVATLLGVPAGLLICAVAIWIRRYPLVDYLAAKGCSRQDLAIGLAGLAIFIAVSDGLTWLSGRPIVPDFMVSVWQTAGVVPLLILALVVAAPVGEELYFRGFLFRGWSESRLGNAGAIVLTAILWGVIHVQYEWFFVTHIIAAGFLLGWLRYRSGSTLLTILLHALMNLVATVQAAVKVELLS